VLLPTLSDRIGLRKIVFVTAIWVNGIAVFTEAYLLGLPLAVASIIWGISAGAVGLVFVVPIEMEGVGPARAGTAVGIVMGAGFLGGVLSPLIGLRLSETHPVLGFAFFSCCYLVAALLFAMIRETGRRRRIPDAESPTQVD
jgi:nitrate/nitrite transporter NarK